MAVAGQKLLAAYMSQRIDLPSSDEPGSLSYPTSTSTGVARLLVMGFAHRGPVAQAANRWTQASVDEMFDSRSASAGRFKERIPGQGRAVAIWSANTRR